MTKKRNIEREMSFLFRRPGVKAKHPKANNMTIILHPLL
jgi:hypothetical protein